MGTYVALLRGINVGGNNKISMSELRQTFETLGFDHVSTYINSGNVIFRTQLEDRQELRRRIETKLHDVFGFDIQVIVRSSTNILMLAKAIPSQWENDTEQKTDVLFLNDAFDHEETLALIKSKPEIDSLIYLEGAIVWHIDRVNYSKSGLSTFIGTTVYKNMSARNVNTVRNLALRIVDAD